MHQQLLCSYCKTFITEVRFRKHRRQHWRQHRRLSAVKCERRPAVNARVQRCSNFTKSRRQNFPEMHCTGEGQHYRDGMARELFYAIIIDAALCEQKPPSAQVFCCARDCETAGSRNQYGNQALSISTVFLLRCQK